MAYKIEQVEGIGESYAAKLREAGINTTDDLLEKCATRSGKLILKWTNHADLFRIKGVAGQFAELLEAVGVDTVKELRHRVADNLAPKLVAINDEKNLCNRVPSVTEIQRMIDQAKELEPIVSY